MSAFTVCWKEEDGIVAIHFHSLILANVLEHFGAGEILLTSEVKHQQDLNKILFLLHYLFCEGKGSRVHGVQNHNAHAFRLNSFCF